METMYVAPEECVEDIHKDVKKWMTDLQFITYEINFLSKDFLNSFAFEPFTKELFDSYEDLKQRMEASRIKCKELIKVVQNHDNEIGGILECSKSKCDSLYRGNHQVIKEQLEVFEAYYQKSKKELMTYASKILKYKKK